MQQLGGSVCSYLAPCCVPVNGTMTSTLPADIQQIFGEWMKIFQNRPECSQRTEGKEEGRERKLGKGRGGKEIKRKRKEEKKRKDLQLGETLAVL